MTSTNATVAWQQFLMVLAAMFFVPLAVIVAWKAVEEFRVRRASRRRLAATPAGHVDVMLGRARLLAAVRSTQASGAGIPAQRGGERRAR